MQKENKSYQIYLNGEFVPVTEEVYKEWYRPIWRAYDNARRHGRCRCTNWQRCEGDCGLCNYQRSGDQVSLNQWADDYGIEQEAYSADPSDVVERIVIREELLREADEIDPDGRKITMLLLNGVDDRKAAESLGISKSAYSRRKIKLRGALRKYWETDS